MFISKLTKVAGGVWSRSWALSGEKLQPYNILWAQRFRGKILWKRNDVVTKELGWFLPLRRLWWLCVTDDFLRNILSDRFWLDSPKIWLLINGPMDRHQRTNPLINTEAWTQLKVWPSMSWIYPSQLYSHSIRCHDMCWKDWNLVVRVCHRLIPMLM